MAKKIILTLFLSTCSFIAISFFTTSHSSTTGAPAGHTGSPGDGKTCAVNSCHAGSSTNFPNVISHNIPGSGYVPGATYSFTASISQGGINKWGFQISPQNASGTYLGTLVVTNSTETQITGTKYITHKSAGTAGTGGRTWTFDWTAPSAGTGNVTFYGAFNATNSNNNTSGDQIYTSSLIVNEDVTASIASTNSELDEVFIQNPVQDLLYIKGTFSSNEVTNISIYDISGRLVEKIYRSDDLTNVLNIRVPFNYRTGTYIVDVMHGEQHKLLKLVKL